MSTCVPTLQEQFGAIDIYLFDQLLRGNVSKGMTIFDASSISSCAAMSRRG